MISIYGEGIMQYSVNLNEDILKKLKHKSHETGIKPDDIINEILSEGLDNYHNTVRLADSFKELVDICDYSEPTDAVGLKQLVRERRL